MDFQTKIAEYKENKSTISSPIWIWFSKTDSGATCNICKSSMPQKSGSTGNMVNHLKRRHGFTQKPNAWKDFEELSSLKDERLQKTRKPESREGRPKIQMNAQIKNTVDMIDLKYSTFITHFLEHPLRPITILEPRGF